MDALGEGGRERAIAFLLAMIDEHERERVVALIGARELGAGEPGGKSLSAPANGQIGEKP